MRICILCIIKQNDIKIERNPKENIVEEFKKKDEFYKEKIELFTRELLI